MINIFPCPPSDPSVPMHRSASPGSLPGAGAPTDCRTATLADRVQQTRSWTPEQQQLFFAEREVARLADLLGQKDALLERQNLELQERNAHIGAQGAHILALKEELMRLRTAFGAA